MNFGARGYSTLDVCGAQVAQLVEGDEVAPFRLLLYMLVAVIRAVIMYTITMIRLRPQGWS